MSKKYFSLRTVGLLSIAATIGFLSTGSQVSAASNYNLISNAVYLNKNSMSRAQIQNFLESKGSKLATYKDQGPNETKKELASYLIWHAAQIWNINPQVIIATLQKEQSLITNPNPSSIALRSAMGYGCPDSAACNTKYYGFANQVNMATYQFRYNYEALKGNSSFVDIDGDVHGVGQYACNGPTHFYNNALRPGNTVTFKRNTAFSSTKDKTVKIANEATASLLCYTPHVGPYSETGYSGSDNFVYWFKQWFGSTEYKVGGAVGSKYNSLGGASSFLGEPQSNEIKLSSGKVYQKFENGRIYWSSATGAWSIHGGIQTKYLSLGGHGGVLGLPTSGETPVTGGVYQQFEGGRIYWTSATGAVNVHGGIATKYLSLGGHGGVLGLPTSGETPVTGGVYQQFAKGRIYWSSKTSASSIVGDILAHYESQVNNTKTFGFPTEDQKTLAQGVYQKFERRDLYKSSEGDVSVILGGVRSRYSTIGGADSDLGFPVSNEIPIKGGVFQQFEKGRIYWSGKTGAWEISGDIEDYFASLNYSNGYLGFPRSGVKTHRGTTFQQFEKGYIYHNDGNTYDTHGAIGSKHNSLDGVTGYLGLPLGNEISLSSGRAYQQFANGRIYWTSTTGARVVSGGIGKKYIDLNAEEGFLGYPSSDEIRVSIGTVYQKYEGGRIYWSGRTGAWSLHGGIQSKYLALGGHNSRLGLPISGEIPTSTGVYQNFQGGRISWKPGKTSVSYK